MSCNLYISASCIYSNTTIFYIDHNNIIIILIGELHWQTNHPLTESKIQADQVSGKSGYAMFTDIFCGIGSVEVMHRIYCPEQILARICY